MVDYLKAARATNNPKTRAKFLRLHTESNLRDSILNCTRCPLAETRTQAVPWSGPTTSPLVLMGEGPGRNEDKQGEPFVGQAGKVLNQALKYAGFAREEVMVMNAVCCRPPANRKPAVDEVVACSTWREKQLKIADPVVVVVMGGSAIEAVTEEQGVKVGQWIGRVWWMDGLIYLATYHPAYILRTRGEMVVLKRDLLRAKEIIDGKWPEVELGEGIEAGKGVREEARKHLGKKGRGWLVIESRVLGEHVLVVRDERVRVPGKIEKMGLVEYGVDELVKIGEWGRSGKGVGRKEMGKVHRVKKEFGGTVVESRRKLEVK